MSRATLTKTQKEAYAALTLEWQSVYEIKSKCGASIATLNALVSKGCARKRIEPGASFAIMRSSLTYYRRIA